MPIASYGKVPFAAGRIVEYPARKLTVVTGNKRIVETLITKQPLNLPELGMTTPDNDIRLICNTIALILAHPANSSSRG